MKSKLYGCKQNPFDHEKQVLYKKGIQLMNKNLNFLSYFKLFSDVDKLKILLLSKEQLALFNYSSKPILTLDPNITDISKAIEEMTDSYKILQDIFLQFEFLSKNPEKITDLDKKLISFLDFDLQNQLIETFDCELLFKKLDSN